MYVYINVQDIYEVKRNNRFRSSDCRILGTKYSCLKGPLSLRTLFSTSYVNFTIKIITNDQQQLMPECLKAHYTPKIPFIKT